MTPVPSNASRQAFIGVGANLRDRTGALRGAADRLRSQPGIGFLDASSIYETDPVGVVDQPRFLNAVFGIETALAPEALLELLLSIERDFGRERTVRWGPRTLDLDLLAFEGETRSTPALSLPHARMLEREFVTVPLREIILRDRFRRGAWDALRARLESLPPPSAAVSRWTEAEIA